MHILRYRIFESYRGELLKWFGDSKVTNLDGSPRLVYHGTNQHFTKFDDDLINNNEPSGDYIGSGIYFTDDRETALKYAHTAVKQNSGTPTIIEAYLKISNPLVISSTNDAKLFRELFGSELEYFKLKKSNPNQIRYKLIQLGYDGLIDNLYHQYAVFSSNQIEIQ